MYLKDGKVWSLPSYSTRDENILPISFCTSGENRCLSIASMVARELLVRNSVVGGDGEEEEDCGDAIIGRVRRRMATSAIVNDAA